MKRLLVLILLFAAPAQAETLAVFLNTLRMIVLDRGTPRAFADSVYLYHARDALQEIGVRTLGVIVDTGFALTDGTLLYTLTRPPLRMISAYRVDRSGAISNIARLPHNDIWKTETENKMAYSIGPGSKVFVSKALSYEDTLHLHYATNPLALPGDSTTAIDLPNGLLAALHYQTAAALLDATKAPSNVSMAAKLEARAERIIQMFLVSRHGEELDSLALPR